MHWRKVHSFLFVVDFLRNVGIKETAREAERGKKKKKEGSKGVATRKRLKRKIRLSEHLRSSIRSQLLHPSFPLSGKEGNGFSLTHIYTFTHIYEHTELLLPLGILMPSRAGIIIDSLLAAILSELTFPRLGDLPSSRSLVSRRRG